MSTREEIATLISYVLSERNRQILINSGLDSLPKDRLISALRGLQDLGWIGHGGLADFAESYSLTKEGRRIVSERPPITQIEKSACEHVEALRLSDSDPNGDRKTGLRKLIEIDCNHGNWDSAVLKCYELGKAAERSKDFGNLAFAAFYQGRVEVSQNRWEEALESYLTAIEKYMEIGDRKGVCEANRAMGVVYGNKGDHDSAIRCFESSLSMAKSIGDRHAESLAEGNLAIIYDLEGRTEESENALKHCLDYFLEVGDHAMAARASINLGVLNMSRDEFQVAGEYFGKTISTSRELNNKELLGISLINAGYCYARTGDISRAITCSDEAVQIFKEPNNQNMLALAFRNYGYVEFRNSKLDSAFEWFEKSVRAARASGVEDTLAACCYEYGMALIKSTVNLRLAAKLLKKSSSVYRGIGNIARARSAEAQLSAI